MSVAAQQQPQQAIVASNPLTVERYVDTWNGNESYMEDRYVCESFTTSIPVPTEYTIAAVFDGHGGYKCAEFFREHFPKILREQFQRNPNATDRDQLHNSVMIGNSTWENSMDRDRSGSTLNAVLINHRTRQVYMANLGDSRSCGKVWFADGAGKLMIPTEFCTVDHDAKNPTEVNRIQAAGCVIRKDYMAETMILMV